MVQQKVPFRCTLITLSQSDSEAFEKVWSRRMPADEDVGAAEMLDGVVEQRLAAFHARDICAVRDCLAALGLDRVHDLLRHRLVGAGAVAGPAEIVDDDGRPFPRKQLCVGFTEPAARAGDQRNLAVE
jgi:hypothetical protein